ncbi:hypothetical protein I6F26_30815 [Ensifer sp. IC3342]|nr:hypothetical protein [Ensifer sp. BRP08]MCA1450899.1 hypothetical protein [Ensifer sp. IC3342]THK34267.1 hypothetical protein EHS39_30975 [Ensifer sp. MPMI2T]
MNGIELQTRYFNKAGVEPMQQIADHLIRSNSNRAEVPLTTGRDIKAVKWRLWHGRVDRAIRDLERLLVCLKQSQWEGEFSISRFTAWARSC